MTTTATILLLVAAALAVTDWYAVERQDLRLEFVAKPGATLALALTAATLDAAHTDTQVLFVVALVASLAGDVFLMLRDRFVAGLASFFVAQVLYAVGFALHGGSTADYLIGVLVAGVIVAPLAVRFVRALRASGLHALVWPLVAYMGAIAAMLVTAIGSGSWFGIVGALLFVISDALIAETRFVRDRPHARLAIMVTYHLALAGLVLSLL
jgi:uncharacterized membrane protein YhhN